MYDVLLPRVGHLESIVFSGGESALVVRVAVAEKEISELKDLMKWAVRLAVTTLISVVGCLGLLVYQLQAHAGGK